MDAIKSQHSWCSHAMLQLDEDSDDGDGRPVATAQIPQVGVQRAVQATTCTSSAPRDTAVSTKDVIASSRPSRSADERRLSGMTAALSPEAQAALTHRRSQVALAIRDVADRGGDGHCTRGSSSERQAGGSTV